MRTKFQKKLIQSMNKSFYIMQFLMITTFILFLVLFQLYTNHQKNNATFKMWNEIYKKETWFYQTFLSQNKIEKLDANEIQFFVHNKNGKSINNVDVVVYENKKLISQTFEDDDLRRNYFINSVLLNEKDMASYYHQTKNLRVIKDEISRNNNIYHVLFFVDLSYLLPQLYEHNATLSDEFGNVFLTNYPLDKVRISQQTFEDKNHFTLKFNKIDAYTNIHTIVKKDSHLLTYLIGVIGILCFSYSILLLVKKFFNRLLNKNTQSLNLLLEEINCIQENNKNYLELNTEDEFQIVAEQFNELLNSIHELNLKNQELVKLENFREHKQLEAQFNPHFLYNTLETIKYLIKINPNESIKLIKYLVEILRYSIDENITHSYFEEDFTYIKSFLKINKIRFQDTFHYTINVSDKMMRLPIPKLLLQPLIENSIKYVYPQKGCIEIHIHGYELTDYYVIEVCDNGNAFDDATLTKINQIVSQTINETQHHGLFITSRRIRLFYGELSRFEVAVNNKNKFIIKIAKKELISHV